MIFLQLKAIDQLLLDMERKAWVLILIKIDHSLGLTLYLVSLLRKKEVFLSEKDDKYFFVE